MAAPPINPGWEYNSDINNMIYNPNSINVNENPDTRTARVFKDVANTLENDIKFTVDTPSNSDNGRMPVLDLTTWVSHKAIEVHCIEEISRHNEDQIRHYIPRITKKVI